jgi:type VI secretion system protein ImpA
MSSATGKRFEAAPHVIEVGAMLAPIPGDRRAGANLKNEGLHDEIKKARHADDAFGRGVWERETKVAEWEKAAGLASDALALRTKDLMVCAWMAEALVKLHGFAGLRDSLLVVRGIHEQFWDDLYPVADEGDFEARANAVALLDKLTAAAVREVPVTEAPGLSYLGWQESNRFNVGPEVDPEQAEERRRRAEKEGKVTSEDWQKAKQATPRDFYETAHATLGECWENVRALDATLDKFYEGKAPSLAGLKQSLEAVGELVERTLKEKRILEPDQPGENGTGAAAEPDRQATPGAETPGAAPNGAAAPARAQGPIQTRREAVGQLAEVAAFFRRTEPHSPVALLVERAIKWCDMPLEAWLESVIKEESVLKSLRETLGMDGKE